MTKALLDVITEVYARGILAQMDADRREASDEEAINTGTAGKAANGIGTEFIWP